MNKPKFKTESTEKLDDNKCQEAAFYVEHSGKSVRPSGSSYVGSICIHIYQDDFHVDKNMKFFATQFCGKPDEHTASMALDHLMEMTMSRYGRNINKNK